MDSRCEFMHEGKDLRQLNAEVARYRAVPSQRPVAKRLNQVAIHQPLIDLKGGPGPRRGSPVYLVVPHEVRQEIETGDRQARRRGCLARKLFGIGEMRDVIEAVAGAHKQVTDRFQSSETYTEAEGFKLF
jgi:hypothetical protein